MLKFEYDGIMSDTKNIIITRIEQNDTIISRSPVLGNKNIYRPRENHFGMQYDSNLSFTIHLIKNPCDIYDTTPKLINNTVVFPKLPKLEGGVLLFEHDMPYIDESGTLVTPEYTDYFSSSEVSAITSWLTSPNYPKLFKILNNNYYYEEINFYAVITEATSDHTDRPYELIYTVVCDSPYGYTPEIKKNITSTSTLVTSVNLLNNSDCHEDYVYPIINVHPLSHGELTIRNVTDNGTLKINMLNKADFYIDCQNLKFYDVVGDILSFDDLGISDIDNIYFPRLCFGGNTFEFTGNAEITITYREQRKVGVFA